MMFTRLLQNTTSMATNDFVENWSLSSAKLRLRETPRKYNEEVLLVLQIIPFLAIYFHHDAFPLSMDGLSLHGCLLGLSR